MVGWAKLATSLIVGILTSSIPVGESYSEAVKNFVVAARFQLSKGSGHASSLPPQQRVASIRHSFSPHTEEALAEMQQRRNMAIKAMAGPGFSECACLNFADKDSVSLHQPLNLSPPDFTLEPVAAQNKALAEQMFEFCTLPKNYINDMVDCKLPEQQYIRFMDGFGPGLGFIF